MSDEGINLNVSKIKKGFQKTKIFFGRKDVQTILTVILLLAIIILGSYIRVQNLDLLKDQTSGEYIPLALDPHYFIRVAETIVNNGGHLPTVDVMRYPAADTGFTNEILPWAIVGIYKLGNIFSNFSIQFAGVISPVIFYILGLIVFFFLCYKLTKSKIASIISSIFLAFIPSYLYRTLSGFADHEAPGMVAFFAVLLVYAFAIEKFEKEKIGKYTPLLFGILAGLLTALTVAAWGGLSNFVFMIIPLTALIIWMVNIKNEKSFWKRNLTFYASWMVFSVLLAPVFGIGFGTVLGRIRSSTGLVSLFVLGFIIVDTILIKIKFADRKIKNRKEFYRIIYSLLITIGLGIIFLLVQGNLIGTISDLFVKILNPFSSAGSSRLGATVAENASPYLSDWINQTGKIFFWISLAGLFFFGFKFFEKIPKKKDKITGIVLWALLIGGIFFSNYSANSILNGDNFISKLFFFGSAILFIWFLAKLLYKDRLKIDSTPILIFSWMILMLIGARGAARLLFVITPFFCFIVGWNYLFVEKRLKQKDEFKKMAVIILLILLVVASIFSLINLIKISNTQAKYTGPSADYQWQNAMSWVRENTPENSIFVHWWDYGYWIQSLGKRPTVTDGGHAAGDNGDHYIGRYILTTQNPETALSFMKTQDVSYLLIDQTDLGKYSAYSRIGSDMEYDRFSYIPVGTRDSSQTQETGNEMINVYPLSGVVDEDIFYKDSSGNEIFLPGPTYDEEGNPSYKSYLAGIVLNTASQNGTYYSKQPEAVYYYNNQQVRIPLKYAYVQGDLIDFGSGLDAAFMVVPRVSNGAQGVTIEDFGAGIYLSPKVSKSLFAQLYLMDDPLNKYPTINLAHSEDDIVVKTLKMQGLDINDFVYYQGFRGPIKIWKVNYPAETKTHEEFLDGTVWGGGNFGGLDYLFE